MIRQRLGRPKWWPVNERDEPLVLPASIGTYAAVVAMIGGAALLLEVLLPAWPGSAGRPPLGSLFNGVVYGALDGLLAVGLILVYRTTRILNFAQAALGAVAAGFVLEMVTGYGLSFWAVAPIGLLVAAGLGAAVELLVVRPFFNAPRLVLTIATVALVPVIGSLVQLVLSQLNPAPAGQAAGTSAVQTLPDPVPALRFAVAPFTFGFPQVFTIGVAVLATAAVTLFLRRTRLGQAVRGAAENAESAWLLGINIRGLSSLVWALAAALSALVAIARLTLTGIDTSASASPPEALLPALVAAMVAGMETMPLALFFGVWFSVLVQGVYWEFPNLTFTEPALLTVMLAALVLQRRRLQRRESKQGAAWTAIRDVRPTPKEMARLPFVVRGRIGVWVLAAAVVAVFPQVHAGGLVLIYVMIAVSLLILAGWGGQVSLGHFALVATGAVVGAGLSSRFGWSFWVALPAAALVGSALAVGLGLPALRLKGLYLAAVTLAFAAAVPRILFDSTYFGWLLPSGQIQRPSLFGIDLASETAFYYVLAVLAAAAVYIGYKLRRTRPGRVLIALRDNEPSAQSVGVSPLTTRLGAFALSGFIAAFAGVLYVHYEGVLTVKDFLPQASLDVFLLLVVGGLGNLTGAVLGALVGAGLRIVTPDHAGLFTGAGAVLILLFAPGGISQLVYAARDAIYRVVALRLHLVVPSLFEDFDLQAHARRKLPLAKPIGGLGLAALPVQRRYSQTSWLWRHTRRGEEVAT